MSNIIAFCGKKGSGKNTCSNFLHGYQMRCYGIVEDFGIVKDTGNLMVTTKALDEDGNEGTTTGEIDITRDDMEFAEWAAYNMWPFIKNYSFAKELKDICMGLFGLTREQVYGTDEQKNTIVEHLRWENMPGVIITENVRLWTFGNLENKTIATETMIEKLKNALANGNNTNIVWGSELEFKFEPPMYHAPGPMTAREFMQFFGTEIMRKIYSPVWTERTIKNIKTENPQIAIVSDCRFKNEAEALKKEKAKLIYLTRSTSSDKHSSENGFEDFNNFDAVIDNQNMTIEESQQELMRIIDSWGWLGDQITNDKGIKKIK